MSWGTSCEIVVPPLFRAEHMAVVVSMTFTPSRTLTPAWWPPGGGGGRVEVGPCGPAAVAAGAGGPVGGTGTGAATGGRRAAAAARAGMGCAVMSPRL